jgi:GH25 family lysozyme M1 (1,4-beta-N-acetylmuramidase)
MAYRLGIDTSKWSGLIRWKEVYDSGLVYFVLPKASQGTLGEDTQWDNSKAGCIQYGFPFGAYHYFMPSLSAIEQARFFVQVVGAGVRIYVCDVESAVLAEAQKILSLRLNQSSIDTTGTIDLRGKLEYTEIEKEAIQIAILTMTGNQIVNSESGTQAITLAQMVKNFMEEVTRLKPDSVGVIYTSPGFWNANVANDWVWDMPYDLWVAHWGVQNPTIPRKWTQWVLWQYTTTLRIPGIDSAEDGNWARDTLNLHEYFGNGEPMPPPALPDKIAVNVANLNIRSTPSSRYNDNIMGTTTYNKIWNPIAIATGPDANGVIREWYQINKYGFLAKWLCRDV